MGPQHSYGIAARLQQVSEDLLYLNQGTLHPALIRLEQQGRIKGTWRKTDSNRDAKFYALTKEGERTLKQEAVRWRRMAGLVERLLSEGA
jgi:DNA-binding PadR family transcriptional regulator